MDETLRHGIKRSPAEATSLGVAFAQDPTLFDVDMIPMVRASAVTDPGGDRTTSSRGKVRRDLRRGRVNDFYMYAYYATPQSLCFVTCNISGMKFWLYIGDSGKTGEHWHGQTAFKWQTGDIWFGHIHLP